MNIAKLIAIALLLALAAAAAQSPPGPQSNPGRKLDESLKTSDSLSVTVKRAPHAFAFAGDITLHIKEDEMTDEMRCTISTPLFGIYLEFYGQAGASVWTSDALKLDYSVKPLMRLGDAPAFELDTTRHPHPMFVPPAHTSDLVRALYSGEKVLVRFTQWPSGDTRTIEIEPGDFASAYDRGAQFCAWPKVPARRAILSTEPLLKTDLLETGGIQATIGGAAGGWTITYDPRYAACGIHGSFLSLTSFQRQRTPDLEVGVVKVLRADGTLVETVEHRGFTPFPVGQLLAAAARAGGGGMVEVSGQVHSLFGFPEAIAYAEKTCSVSFH